MYVEEVERKKWHCMLCWLVLPTEYSILDMRSDKDAPEDLLLKLHYIFLQANTSTSYRGTIIKGFC